jgi:hypothetical protein
MKHLIKILVISILLIAGSLVINAQEDKIINHTAGQAILSVSPDLLLNTPNGTQLAGGIKFQLFLGKRLSIDADLVIGKDYYHFGPGVIGVPLALFALGTDEEFSFDNFSDFLISLAVIALSFEHLSYHIPVRTDLDISPYISVLRYKSSSKHTDLSDPDFISDQLSFATGVQVYKYFGRFVLSPYGEYNLGYKDLASRFNLGVYLGYYFSGQK